MSIDVNEIKALLQAGGFKVPAAPTATKATPTPRRSAERADTPPTPKAMSNEMEPVEITCTSRIKGSSLPSRMI